MPQRGNPELSLHIDPTRASKAGLTVAQITSQLTSGLLGQQATSFRSNDRLIDVRVRFPDRQRFDLGWLREFPLTTEAGTVVPLSAVATVDTAEGETELHREDLRQMMPITGRLEGRDLGSGIRDVQAALAAAAMADRVLLASSVGSTRASRARSDRCCWCCRSPCSWCSACWWRSSAGSLPAIVILSAAPLSLAGAFGLLLLTGTPLNVSSMMGLILLIGLIVKNGIILVDYADIVAARGGGSHRGAGRSGGRAAAADPDDHAVHAVRSGCRSLLGSAQARRCRSRWRSRSSAG